MTLARFAAIVALLMALPVIAVGRPDDAFTVTCHKANRGATRRTAATFTAEAPSKITDVKIRMVHAGAHINAEARYSIEGAPTDRRSTRRGMRVFRLQEWGGTDLYLPQDLSRTGLAARGDALLILGITSQQPQRVSLVCRAR